MASDMDRIGHLIAKVEEVRHRVEAALLRGTISRGTPLLARSKWSVLKDEWRVVRNALIPATVPRIRRLLLLDCDLRFDGVLRLFHQALMSQHGYMTQNLRRRDLLEAWNQMVLLVVDLSKL
jgi:hypothetical protein